MASDSNYVAWATLANINYSFGGLDSGRPLSVADVIKILELKFPVRNYPPGWYTKVNLNEYGIAIDAGQFSFDDIPFIPFSKIINTPTNLEGYGITNAQPLSTNLTKLAEINASGFYKQTPTGQIITLQTIGHDNLPDSGIVPDTYAGISFNAKGLAVSGRSLNPSDLPSNIPWSKIDFPNQNLVPGWYTKLHIDQQGLVDAANLLDESDIPPIPFSRLTALPPTLAGHGITDAQPLSTNLTKLANLVGVGVYRQNQDGSIVLDNVVGTINLPDSGITSGTYAGISINNKGIAYSARALVVADLPNDIPWSYIQHPSLQPYSNLLTEVSNLESAGAGALFKNLDGTMELIDVSTSTSSVDWGRLVNIPPHAPPGWLDGYQLSHVTLQNLIDLNQTGYLYREVDGTFTNRTEFGITEFPNTGISPDTYAGITINSKGLATTARALIASDIPDIDLSKISTGIDPGVRLFMGSGNLLPIATQLHTSSPVKNSIEDTDKLLIVDESNHTLASILMSLLKSTLKTFLDQYYLQLQSKSSRTYGGTWASSVALTGTEDSIEVYIHKACTLKSLAVYGKEGVGGCQLDVRVSTTFPPGGGDTICNGQYVQLIAASSGVMTDFTQWSLSTIPANRWMSFKILTTSNFKKISIQLSVEE